MVIDKRICETRGPCEGEALRWWGSAMVGLCDGGALRGRGSARGGSARAGLCEGGVLRRRGLVVFCCGQLHARGGRRHQRRGRSVIG